MYSNASKQNTENRTQSTNLFAAPIRARIDRRVLFMSFSLLPYPNKRSLRPFSLRTIPQFNTIGSRSTTVQSNQRRTSSLSSSRRRRTRCRSRMQSHHSQRPTQRIPTRIERHQKPRQLLAQLPVALVLGPSQQTQDELLARFDEFVERVQDEEVAACGLEVALGEGLLKEVARGWEVGEEGAPGADFGFARALDNDFEELGEGGEEGEDGWQEGLVGGWRGVDFLVENVVQEHFEGVREVLEMLVMVGEKERRGGVVLRQMMTEHLGEEELCLDQISARCQFNVSTQSRLL
jgi:hypothetical protein